MSKLEGFPSVYYLSLEESVERREHLINQFKEYGITNIHGVISKRFEECNDIVKGQFINDLLDASKGACTSHMRCIKRWLNETDEPYGFFCEDDLSLEPVQYWNFTWKEFFDSLPEDWEIVQLTWVRDENLNVCFRERWWDDWAATGYIVKRHYAQKLVDTYYSSEEFTLDIPFGDWRLTPIIENMIFLIGKAYGAPLFLEEVNKFDATLINSRQFEGLKDGYGIVNGQGPTHIKSHNIVLDWWKNNSQHSFEKLTGKSKNKNIVDCFTYFNDKELLELRVNLLKDYVDKFIIVDANYTQSGNPKSYDCKKIIKDLGLPENIIEVIEIDLSEENLGPITDYERLWEKTPTIASRERLQRDSIVKCLETNNFNEDTVFIVSDIDEIIDPKYIPLISKLSRENKNKIFKYNLDLLSGRADFRLHYKDSDQPVKWCGPFFCLKEHMQNSSLTCIRSNCFHPYEIDLPNINNETNTYGWHFTWMGGSERRFLKSQSVCHFNADFEHHIHKNYFKQKDKWKEFFSNYEFYEGNICPSGDTYHYIKSYPIQNLPNIIFKLPNVKNFLLPQEKNKTIENLLISYAYDTENPQINFDIAQWYHTRGQTASAITYYLRAADRSDDLNFAYECLLHTASCFNAQGNRDHTVKGLYKHAISILPRRPEAYYLLARFYEWGQDYAECYTHTSIALSTCDFDLPPLSSNVDYPGKYGLVYEKAVSSYWWGKSKECRELFLDLKQNYELNEIHKQSVGDNLMKLGCWVEESIKYDKSKFDRFKFKFPELENIESSYGQALQDMFVLSILNGKKNGTYLEIGAQQPFFQNNTVLLETNYDWKGVSIEIKDDLCRMFSEQRNNTILCKDATTINYEELLEKHFDTLEIDYLQLDIEPSKNTFECLLAIPFEKYKFAVITYEHDYFVDMTETYRTKSRNYLKLMGYELVVSNVSQNENTPFEDWWVHPDLIDKETIEKFKSIKDVNDMRKYFYS